MTLHFALRPDNGTNLYPPRRLWWPIRLNWQIKTLLPVALVLVNGLLLFVLVTLTLQDPARNQVLAVGVAGAVVICAVLFMVLAVVIHRPMLELQHKIAQVRAGDLFVNVELCRPQR